MFWNKKKEENLETIKQEEKPYNIIIQHNEAFPTSNYFGWLDGRDDLFLKIKDITTNSYILEKLDNIARVIMTYPKEDNERLSKE